MNITLSVDDVSFPISYSMIADLVLGLDEYLPEQRQALICLANHNDYTVRAVVAGKENLPQECYRQLADDASIEVLSELLTNKSFHQYATMDIYQKMLQRDPRLLSEISSNIAMIEPELLAKVAQWLLSLDDYKVKWDMAGSISTPKSLLRVLAGDSDETIAELARSQFSTDGATVFDVDDEVDPLGERDD